MLSCRADAVGRLEAVAKRFGVPLSDAGVVGEPGGALSIRLGGTSLAWNVQDLRTLYYEAIPRRMRQESSRTTEV